MSKTALKYLFILIITILKNDVRSNATSNYYETSSQNTTINSEEDYVNYTDIQTSKDVYKATNYEVRDMLWMDFSTIRIIKPGVFIEFSNLTILMMRYNFIEDLERGVFQGLHNLTELRLDGNRIKTINEGVFNTLENLSELNLDNNMISDINGKAFEGLHNLKVLSLAHNNISAIEPNTFHSLLYLHILKLNRNKLTSLDAKTFEKQRDIRFLRLDNNKLTQLPPSLFSYLINLKHLNLKENLLSSLQLNKSETFRSNQKESNMTSPILPKLVSLRLSQNNLENLEHIMFKQMPSLKILDLSYNKITKVPQNVFVSNARLEILILSNNPQMHVSTNSPFLNVSSLKFLYMTECGIKEVSRNSLSLLPNLQELYLHGNSLHSFNEEVLTSLSNLTHLTLYDNPLICNCELKRTREWFLENNLNLTDKTPHCLKSGSGKSWGTLQNISCETSFHVTLKRFVEPVVLGIIFFFGAIGTGSLLLVFASYERIIETPNSCIFSLALGDFIMIMIFIPMNYTIAFTPPWKFGIALCKTFMFLRDFIIAITVFSILMFSFHTYTFTISAYRMRNSGFGTYSKTAVFHLLGIWFMSFVLSSPILLSATIDDESCVYATESLGYHFIHHVAFIQFFLYLVLPLFFIVLIHFVSKRHVKLKNLNDNINNERLKIRKDVTLNVLSLSLVFVVSYSLDLFMRILIAWSIIDRYSNVADFFLFVAECLYFSNAWLNPLVIYLSCKSYEIHFKRILYCERFRKRSFRRRPTPAYTVSSGVSDQQSSILDFQF